jgi:hypothetical protein
MGAPQGIIRQTTARGQRFYSTGLEMAKGRIMDLIEADDVILLRHGAHSIQLSRQEVLNMKSMDANGLRTFFHGKRIPVKSPTNDALRAIECDLAQIPAAIANFVLHSNEDDDSVEIEPAG